MVFFFQVFWNKQIIPAHTPKQIKLPHLLLTQLVDFLSNKNSHVSGLAVCERPQGLKHCILIVLTIRTLIPLRAAGDD
jgi:hypothetical protein